MTYWHPSSTIFVIDDSDDEAEQYVPQHQDKDAGDGDEGNIDHASPTDASSSISTELGRHCCEQRAKRGTNAVRSTKHGAGALMQPGPVDYARYTNAVQHKRRHMQINQIF